VVGPTANPPPRIWTIWLRLAALTVFEFAWTAKLVVGVLAGFNLLIFVDSRSPVGLKIMMPLLTWSLVLVLRRLTVTPSPEPRPLEGVAVNKADAPGLWSLVRGARAFVHGPRVRRMVVGHGAELSLRRERRRWRLGRRRVLAAGFGFIAACSQDELRALVGLVLADGRRARFADAFARSSDIYWRRLEVAERCGARTFLSRPFYRWFTRRFSDELGRLATARVLRADQAVAQATSPEIAARVLAKDRAVQAFLGEEFWASVWSRAAMDASPPDNVQALMATALSELGESPACSRWLTEGLDAEIAFWPSLRRRLKALGQSEDGLDPRVIFNRSAPGIPPEELEQLSRRLSERWSLAVAEEWRVQHGEHELAQAELERLDDAEHDAVLADESLSFYAALIERFRGSQVAVEFYERAAAANTDDPVAQFHLGRLRLAAGDMSGLEWLERAIALDHDALVPACSVAEHYLRSMGRPQDAGSYAARSAEFSVRRAEAEWAASRLDKDDLLERHGLAPASVAAIRDRARQLRDVDALFLARRALPGFPGEVRYLAIALRRRPTFGLERRDADRRLAVAVHDSVPFPEGTTVYATTVDGDPAWLRFRAVPGTEVYRRNWRSTVKWGKVLFIAGALAMFASVGGGELVNEPAVNAAVFFLVLAGGTLGLYMYERRRPSAE
jgi:hypothetical protein